MLASCGTYTALGYASAYAHNVGYRVTVMRKKNYAFVSILKGVLLPAAVICILLFFAAATNSLDGGRQGESLKQLNQALRRASVALSLIHI